MNIVDCHVHTAFSFDSKEPMENYVKTAAELGDTYFISTEHVDLESFILNREDILRDIDRQVEVVKQLNEKYPVKVLLGVELGWRKSIRDRIDRIGKKYPFDMILLSIHETEYADVAHPDYIKGRSVDDCFEEYLSLALQAIEDFENFDSFTHIDYLLRYIGDTDLNKHRESLEKVFKGLISKGKALEINSKIFPDTASMRRAEEIIKMYTDLGGEKFTLGSDSHSAAVYKNGVDAVINMLKAHGVKYVCHYVSRQEHHVEI
ncbi:MAG: histidinol-phosphatase HisJ family protein [Oscillospiraceae bacterium]|nr:histidinol-phosphatase HisJ family protein [Oscillospiraceae bacterium]